MYIEVIFFNVTTHEKRLLFPLLGSNSMRRNPHWTDICPFLMQIMLQRDVQSCFRKGEKRGLPIFEKRTATQTLQGGVMLWTEMQRGGSKNLV